MRTTTIIAPLARVRAPAQPRSRTSRLAQGVLFALGIVVFGIGMLTVWLLSLPVRLFRKLAAR